MEMRYRSAVMLGLSMVSCKHPLALDRISRLFFLLLIKLWDLTLQHSGLPLSRCVESSRAISNYAVFLGGASPQHGLVLF